MANKYLDKGLSSDIQDRRPKQNKGGVKGATGPGKGFMTPRQAGGKKVAEDTPGLDWRTFGNRRYGKGATLPGGAKAKVDHGVYRDASGKPDGSRSGTMAGQTPASRMPLKAKRIPGRGHQ